MRVIFGDSLFLYGLTPGEVEAQSEPLFGCTVTKNHPRKWALRVGGSSPQIPRPIPALRTCLFPVSLVPTHCCELSSCPAGRRLPGPPYLEDDHPPHTPSFSPGPPLAVVVISLGCFMVTL